MSQFLSLSKVFNPNPGWYRGDFHCHTNHSDGVHTPPELVEVAKAAGLDFFAITDHNRIGAYPGFGDDPGLLVIPGIEVTIKDGHFNVFGVDAELDWIGDICGGGQSLPRLKGNYQTSSDLMRRMAAQGLLNSINHPLLRPWAWEDSTTDVRNLHCLEIWNDPSWPDNKRDNP
ncbi:MAG: CehA/McbA family metallohydrolase, partial [Chloroflexi bacterium]|nr:CehA/McbA family metallohydrolase [Chloroflexota bacterium]